MKLKAYEKIVWMVELGAIYLLGTKGSVLVHPEGKDFIWSVKCGKIYISAL